MTDLQKETIRRAKSLIFHTNKWCSIRDVEKVLEGLAIPVESKNKILGIIRAAGDENETRLKNAENLLELLLKEPSTSV